MSTDNDSPTADNRVEETVHTDWEGYDHPGTAIVERVADLMAREITDLPFLQSTVDVDAMETLLSRGGEAVQMTFQYAGLWVTIRSDRSMLLEVPANPTA